VAICAVAGDRGDYPSLGIHLAHALITRVRNKKISRSVDCNAVGTEKLRLGRLTTIAAKASSRAAVAKSSAGNSLR
jgi:hypothetical protein